MAARYVYLVIARFAGGKDLEGDFDLTLDLSRAKLEGCQNLGNLRDYLTLDSSSWRWCQRQTKPTMLPEEHPQGASDAMILSVNLQPTHLEVSVVPQPSKEPAFTPITSLPVQPVEEWTEPPVRFKDGTVLLFHRKRWPNGVMTETVERLSPGLTTSLI